MLKKIAHNTTIPSLAGNSDIKPLQDLIIAEKAVLGSLQRLSADFAKASELLRQWATHEGDDLSDTLNTSTVLLTHFSSALAAYSLHAQTIRDHLKAVRTREEALEDMKRRRKSLLAKAESADKKLSRMGPEHKNLAAQTDIFNRLNDDIRLIDREIIAEETNLADFKRTAARSSLGVKFGGMLEFCEKGMIIGEVGKLVASEIPIDVTQPGAPRSIYTGHAKVESLAAEAKGRLEGIKFSATLLPLTVPPDQVPTRPVETRYDDYGWNNAGSVPAQQSTFNQIPLAMPRPSHAANPQRFDRGDSMDAPGLGPTTSDPHLRVVEHTLLPPPPPPQTTIASHRSVDEFGVTNVTTSTAAGGRFVTFPVKGNTRPSPLGAGAGARSERSLTLGLSSSGHGKSESLSSSIAAALGGENLFSPGHRKNTSNDSSYRQRRSIDGETNSLVFVPPLRNLPDPWQDSDANEVSSQEEPQLAYTRYSPESHQLFDEPVRQSEDNDPSTRSGPAGYANEENESNDRNVVRHEDHAGLFTISEGEQSATVPQSQSTASVPQANEKEGEERALNAAAAREISREMDVLQFNPPSPVTSIHLTDASRGTSQNRGVSPVQPVQPLPLNISPRQSWTIESTPQAHSPSSPSRSYTSSNAGGPAGPRNADNPPSPRFNTALPVLPPINISTPETPTSLIPGPLRTPSEIPYDVGSAPFPLPSIKPSLPLSPAALPGTRTIAAAAFKRPYQRNMSGPGAVGGGGGIDTGSGLVRKPSLPSSPYPPRHLHRDNLAGNAGPVQPRVDDMGMQPVRSDSYAQYHSQQQQQQLQHQHQQPPPGNVGPVTGYPQEQQPQHQQPFYGLVDPANGYSQQQQQPQLQPRHQAPYGNVGPAMGYAQQLPPPPPPSYGNLASVGSDEGQYDYITAYMTSTGSVESADGAPHHGPRAGYNDGRYTTDLEGGLR